ncbi:MAG: sensor domain-containing diguanylate cyclase [Syntrophomonas sp.]|nr:sensor domain-containing diguanylate cyclase [Syntrophomonas sp.]
MAERILTTDVERLEMEEKLRESEEKYRLLFEWANDGIILIDNMTVVDCNRRAADIFGCPQHVLLGSTVERFIPPVQLDGRSTMDILTEKGERVLQGEPKIFELGLWRCDGTEFDVELSLNYIQLQGRKMVQVIMRDITARKQMEEWLRYLNMHDKPTGLYNRNYFEEEMQRMQRGRFDPVGIVVCDVDGLKLVNDNLGHGAGDMLLFTVAQILLKCFRESDVVARIGGDEFAVLLPDCSPEIVAAACDRIRETVADTRNSSPPVPISLSVGWAVKENACQSMVDVFKEADNHMYLEKPHNRQAFREFFTAKFIRPQDN